MEAQEIRALARSWVASGGRYSNADNIEAEPPALLDRLVLDAPSTAWQVIEEIHHLLCSAEVDYNLMGVLAANHLEDLLVEHGTEVIGDLEELASVDAEFRRCLSGVWQNNIDEDIYARVQAASDPDWEFEQRTAR